MGRVFFKVRRVFCLSQESTEGAEHLCEEVRTRNRRAERYLLEDEEQWTQMSSNAYGWFALLLFS